MPRLGGGLNGSSYLLNVGSNTETLPTTAPNVPIVSDRAPMAPKSPYKKPLRAASFVIPRMMSAPVDSTPVLPDRAPDSRPSTPTKKSRSSFRAAEGGRGDLLPTSTVSNRLRSQSSSNVQRITNRRNTTGPEQLQAMTQSLRNRRSSVHLDEEFNAPFIEDNVSRQYGSARGVTYSWSDTFGKTDKPNRRSDAMLSIALLNMKRGQLFQALVMLAVTFFVWDSYYKAMTATTELLNVKHDESMMMLHLKRLEEQSLNLHESITRLTERGVAGRDIAYDSQAKASENVDADLIKVQYEQLKQMEGELDHEVKSLQNKIRQTDRQNIVRTFGEGPVQLVLEVEFGEVHTSSSQLSILLWYETPHAAWTLIHQIRRGLWDGAVFDLDRNLALTAHPKAPDTEKRLEFVEKGQKLHEPWTVGLTESDNGALSMFINLQDNSQYHKHDVCIGKIIDGFDTLQRLTRSARNGNSGASVAIKHATASHLTRRESAGLI